MEMLYIIYPGGRRTQLMVYAIASDELHEYALASRERWEEEDVGEAIRYAKELATQHGLTYVHNNNLNVPDYLD